MNEPEIERSSRLRVLMWIALLAWSVSTLAQSWNGPAELGLTVVDGAGAPIANAAVILRPESDEPVALPPPFFTDGDGRLQIEGLAEGEWQVEVRAGGFMIFSSYVKLVAGVPPVVGFTTKQRTGTFWAALDVRFSLDEKVDREELADALQRFAKSDRKELKRLAEAQRRAEKQASESERLAQQRAERRRRSRGGEVATLEEPVRVAETAPEPVASPSRPAERGSRASLSEPEDARETAPESQAPRSSVAAAGEPEPGIPVAIETEATEEAAVPVAIETEATEEAAVPVAIENGATEDAAVPPAIVVAEERPEPARSLPVAEAGAGAESESSATRITETRPADLPRPAPRPPSPPASRPAAVQAVPRIESRPVLFSGGACPECKTGEWSLVVERIATPRSGEISGCGENREELVEGFLLRQMEELGAAGYAGPLVDSYGSSVADRSSSAVDDPAWSGLDSAGACQNLVAVLPASAKFVGFRFEVSDDGGRSDCFGSEPCALGEAHWTENPQIERGSGHTLVHSSFVNESTSRARRARLIVLFVPPRGWQRP